MIHRLVVLGLVFCLSSQQALFAKGSITVHTVCPAGPPVCNYDDLHAAVAAAKENDVIQIAAGDYKLSSTLIITQSLTLRGGYTTDFTEPPNPRINFTTIDAQGNGGVIQMRGSISPSLPISPTLEGLRLTGGKADNGGGVESVNAYPTIRDSYIFSNSAIYNGGGLDLVGDIGQITLVGNTIVSNTANEGGGISAFSTNLYLTNNVILSNTALGELIIENTRSLTERALVNQAQLKPSSPIRAGGGGLFLRSQNVTCLANNIIQDNLSKFRGGGLYMDYSQANFTNNLVVDNKSYDNGNGLWALASTIQMEHTTLARNNHGDSLNPAVMLVADYYAPDLYLPTRVMLTNSIIVSQELGLLATSGTTVTLEATLWGNAAWANTTDIKGEGGYIYTGTLNLWEDPRFASPDVGDYHLRPDSPAIDVGVNAGVYTDIDGEPRPYGAGFDIGADEYWANPPQKMYLPLVLKP